jgi:hypothetical protein
MWEKLADLFEEPCSAEKLSKEVKRMVMKERQRVGDDIREHLVVRAPKDFLDELWGS